MAGQSPSLRERAPTLQTSYFARHRTTEFLHRVSVKTASLSRFYLLVPGRSGAALEPRDELLHDSRCNSRNADASRFLRRGNGGIPESRWGRHLSNRPLCMPGRFPECNTAQVATANVIVFSLRRFASSATRSARPSHYTQRRRPQNAPQLSRKASQSPPICFE